MPRAQLQKEKQGRPPVENRTASRVLYELIEILLAQNLSYRKVAKMAGFNLNAPTRWARGLHAPSILTCEALAEVLGYRLVLEKVEQNDKHIEETPGHRGDVDEPARSATEFEEGTGTS